MTPDIKSRNTLIDIEKVKTWEQAKGFLRTLVALDGARISSGLATDRRFRYEVVSEAVEDFIKDFETKELQL